MENQKEQEIQEWRDATGKLENPVEIIKIDGTDEYSVKYSVKFLIDDSLKNGVLIKDEKDNMEYFICNQYTYDMMKNNKLK